MKSITITGDGLPSVLDSSPLALLKVRVTSVSSGISLRSVHMNKTVNEAVAEHKELFQATEMAVEVFP